MDMILRKIIEGVANTRGEAFFQANTEQLNQVFAVNSPFISRQGMLSTSFRPSKAITVPAVRSMPALNFR